MSIKDMKYMEAGSPQRTYVAGSVVEFKVGVSTHHWGHYEFRICDRALDQNLESAEVGQRCLNSWVLERAPRSPACGNSFEGDCQRKNPEHPERWYLPPPGSAEMQVAGANWDDDWARPVDPNNEVHTMRFIIPTDLRCDHCTLQWYYATGNTCAYDADYFDFDPGFKFWLHYKASWAKCENSCCGPQGPGLWAEEFWNCADIAVVAESQNTQVTTSWSSSTAAETTLEATVVPTVSPTTNPITNPPPLASPVSRHGRLRTFGNRIVDEHGEAVHLRGMSFFWSQWSEGSRYYNRNVVQWLYEDWHVTLVRIAMGVQFGGFLENPSAEMARVRAVVEAAIAIGVYVIIDWHDHHAEQHIAEAKTFFGDVARMYGKSPNVIFETFNEPMHQSWADVIKPYHQELVPVIREHSDNLIILGCRTWSQDVDEASHDPVEGINLAYTLHFYANTHRESLRQKASSALDDGVPLFVTEWGTCSADGNGELDLQSAQAWLDFLALNHISDANWAISDKDEKCAALRPGADTNGAWTESHLTTSGAFIRRSIRAFNDNPNIETTTTEASLSTGRSTSIEFQSTSEVTEPEPEPEPVSSTSTSITSARSTQISTTSIPNGNCDGTCRDIKDTKDCQDAQRNWLMCSSSDSWWHGQCQATCSKCASGLAPCTSPLPTTCDPECMNSKSDTDCQDADTVWNMCTGSSTWWIRQCAAFCGACRGGLPPCVQQEPLMMNEAEQTSSHFFREVKLNVTSELEDASVSSCVRRSLPSMYFPFLCWISYLIIV
jgi:endoglucanase